VGGNTFLEGQNFVYLYVFKDLFWGPTKLGGLPPWPPCVTAIESFPATVLVQNLTSFRATVLLRAILRNLKN